MIAPAKMDLLQRFLGSLPPEMAGRLAKAVEVDRLSGGTALPHDLILDGLRPVLRHADAMRIPTPRRLFFRPVEDLFLNRPRKDKQRGMIGRDSIMPLWNWLEQSLLPEATSAYVRDCRMALLGGKPQDAIVRAGEFWTAASGAILSTLTDKAGRARAKAVLIHETILADAEEMGILLGAAPELLEIQALLQRPAGNLPEPELVTLRAIHDRVAEKAPDAAAYVAVIAMRRLARPWEALRLPVFVSRQAKDTLISSTDMGLVGEVLFAELDEHLGVIRAARHPDFDPAVLVPAVAGFSELSMGLVKEVEMRRDGKWGQRLVKARAAAAESMEALVERSGREILAALPTQRASYTGGARTPDLSRAPDESKRERARRYAQLIAGARAFAAAVSVGAVLKGAEDEVRVGMRSYAEDLLRELRTAEGDQRLRGEDLLGFAADLTALLVSPEEAEFLRRRGRAAAPQAEPASQSAA